jgi:predicted ATPase/DNA-binding winged helix-turn-helix (wHTH) protein
MSGSVQAVDFGRYHLVPAQRMLVSGGVPIPLGARAFDILVALVEHRGEVVSKDELMRQVWGGQAVEENTLAVHLSALRKALGDGKKGARYIRTVPGRGYQFLVPVHDGDQADEASSVGWMPTTHLPRAVGALIGREAELAAVSAEVGSALLVTLTGPGGIGKTRLALAVAEHVVAEYPDGAWWVDLTPVHDASLVAGTVARALGLQLGDAPPLPGLAASLKGLRRLLILDNCEHVAAGAAELAVALREVGGIRLLATSLEPLGVAGEQVERLEPLVVPEAAVAQVAAALEAPAVQLFVARAQAAAQDFVLDERNVGMVVRMCRRLEGVPLALELAAVRVALLGAEPVAQRLDERLLELSSGRRDVLPKHQTLRALLAWSYGLLSSPERVVLRRLSVFAGGCTLEAAEAVVADAAMPEWGVAEHVASLIAKSLVIAEHAAQGARYRLLETTRAYARERLVEAGEVSVVMRRHAEYLCRVFEQADLALEKMASGKWAAQWWPELDNLRTALDFCFASEASAALGVNLTAASNELLHMLGDEGTARIDTAFTWLDDAIPASAVSAIWLGKYWHARYVVNIEDAFHAAERSLHYARISQEPVRLVRAMFACVDAMRQRETWHEMEYLLNEIRVLSVKYGYDKNIVMAAAEIGKKYILEGNFSDADIALRKANELCHIVKDDKNRIYISILYSQLYAVMGDFTGATIYLYDVLHISKEIKDIETAYICQNYILCLMILVDNIQDARNMLINLGRSPANATREFSDLICSMLLNMGGGNYMNSAAMYGYIGKKWPHIKHARLLTGSIFRRLDEILKARIPERLLEGWVLDGSMFCSEEIDIVVKSGIECFLNTGQ